MRKHLLALVILFGCMAGVAAGQRSSAAGTLADAFVHAWNTHDDPAFGRLYAADANWVTVGGETTGASQSKAHSRRSTRVGLARRLFARRTLWFG
jgi:hypothetical protein